MEQNLKETIMDYDPMMKRNIKVTRITEASQTFQQMLKELKRQKETIPYCDVLPQVGETKSVHYRTLNHQHHLRLTLSSHHRFHLLSFLHTPKVMTLMTLLPFRQKVNSQTQRRNAYITPLHILSAT
jgi:hypothetical protein